MKILILDDDRERHDAFEKVLGSQYVVHTYDLDRAADAVKSGAPFDLALLDHDLGTVGNGLHFAEWLTCVDADRRPAQVIVHSWNIPAADRMVDVLRKAGMPVRSETFGRDLLQQLREMCSLV